VVDWLLVDVWALERYLLVEKLGSVAATARKKISGRCMQQKDLPMNML
jgi:hypothetical protein